MSDERDETRRLPPSSGDETLPGSPPPRGDDTLPGVPSARTDDTLPGVPPSLDDDTLPAPPPVRAGDTLADGEAARPGSTAVMPASTDDWAPSRANPVWKGRAEVRAPQPSRTSYDTDWPERPQPVRRDRWWMPIVVGILVLVMLAVLGWAVFLIIRSVDRKEMPAPSTTAATTAPATTQPTTAPTTAPATTAPTSAAPTTEPTSVVTVPALRGLALADAEAALQRSGLSYRLIYRAGAAPPGTVIDCDPAEGQEVPPDTTVILVVTQGATGTPTGAATTTAGPPGTGVDGN